MDRRSPRPLTRFNEAIDESLAEAVSWYTARIEDARELLNGVLAHDLRSPLGAVLTSAEVLLRDDDLNAQQMRTVVRVRNGATRMRTMISDLLDFTRTRLGTGLPMAIDESNIEMIVRDVCEEQRALHPDVTIRCESSGNLTGRWDSSRMAQMLANLIGNAVEHGGRSSVTVIAEGQNDAVALKVRNEGGAIPEEEQRVIFDPLRRAVVKDREGRPTGDGLGLGLYIARQIAEAHGGTIEVNSSEDEGTTFTVRVPRQPEKSAQTGGLT